MPHRTPIDPKALCRCGHSRAQHQNITGKRQCLDCDCQCFKLPGQNTWPCGCLKTDHPYSESTDACFEKFEARATRKMRPDDVCTCNHTRQQHLLVAPTGCGRCHCTAFVLDLERTVAALAERSAQHLALTRVTPDVSGLGRGIGAILVTSQDDDPADTADVELCKICHGPARYEVRIELLILYDFPVANFSWYLCAACVDKGQMLCFKRGSEPVRSPTPCDA